MTARCPRCEARLPAEDEGDDLDPGERRPRRCARCSWVGVQRGGRDV